MSTNIRDHIGNIGNTVKSSPYLLEKIREILQKPAERALFEKLAEAVRNSPYNESYDDDAILHIIDILQLEPEKSPPQDDRLPGASIAMQHMIAMDPGPRRDAGTAMLVDSIWNMLPHPPAPVGPTPPQYYYRQADGAFNNPDHPEVGRAGGKYGRTNAAAPKVKECDLPDPGLIFDLLMARKGEFQPHVAGFSTMFFAHAALITHDIFSTNRANHEINNASSYIDLGPLYGNNQTEQNTIRTFVGGEIKRDSFLDKRILALPPAVSVMVIMYSRFHNYAARTLAAINEDGRFTVPDANDTEAVKKRDNDLFQVARLVTNGLYITVTVNDYIRAIFNLPQTNSTWALEPQRDWAGIPRGVGNHVSREFNLIYRFHSVQSEKESTWTTKFIQEMFPGQDVPNMSPEKFFAGLGRWMQSIPDDPMKRTFNYLVRNEDGSYNDKDLVEILQGAIADPAGNFGTNHIPEVLKPLEIQAILQAREWKVAPLNAFRKFLNRTQLTTFEKINPNPEVVKSLKKLYKTPDDVEMYVGFLAEETRTRMDPAVGICAPYTVSGAVLGDAASLIRGDRHLTTDYKPEIVTRWGISETASDSETLGGSKLHFLILNAFPDWFQFNSAYAMQPFYTVAENAVIFKKLSTDHLYSFDAPSLTKPPVVISAHASVKRVLQETKNFKVPRTEYLPTYLPEDPVVHAKQRGMIGTALHSGAGIQHFGDYAKQITFSLLEERRIVNPSQGYRVDIVKDIGNIVALHFAAVLCYLPLKFKFNSTGTYLEPELYAVLTNLVEYISYNSEPTKTWALRRDLAQGIPKLTTVLTANVKALVGQEVDSSEVPPIHIFGATFVKSLLKAGAPVGETTEILIGNAISVIGTVGLVFAQIIDFYLKPENKCHWDQIIILSATECAANDAKLTKYILEASRLTTTLTSVRRVNPADGKPITLVADQAGRTVTVTTGDRVITSCDASRDPTVFPKPNEVDLNRDTTLYLNFGLGARECLGRAIGSVCLLVMLKAVAGLKNLRRSPGPEGQLKLVTRPNGLRQYMTPNQAQFTSLPTTMVLFWDDKVEVSLRT